MRDRLHTRYGDELLNEIERKLNSTKANLYEIIQKYGEQFHELLFYESVNKDDVLFYHKIESDDSYHGLCLNKTGHAIANNVTWNECLKGDKHNSYKKGVIDGILHL
eukprot:328818_1